MKFIVILPTNILKEEVACKLDIKGVSVFMTASVRGNSLIPGEVREEIQDAHNMGMHEQGKRILKEYRDEIKDDPDVPENIPVKNPKLTAVFRDRKKPSVGENKLMNVGIEQ